MSSGSPPPAGENGRLILLVDDDDIVRSIAGRLLERMGYRVVSAENGQRALERFEAAPDGFALVILDMIMPEMNGEEVFHAIRHLRPSQPILLASGYSLEWKTQSLLQQQAVGFIQKPYLYNELADAVRGAIAGRPAC